MDPITDMLNRIRNAQAVSKKTVLIPFSKLKFEISKILEREHFIKKAEKKNRKEKRMIEIILNYETTESDGNKEKANIRLRRISKPGLRVYSGVKEMKRLKKGNGILVISTQKGIITDKESRKQGVGGEVLFEVW